MRKGVEVLKARKVGLFVSDVGNFFENLVT